MARPTNRARVVKLVRTLGQHIAVDSGGIKNVHYLPLNQVREVIGSGADKAVIDLLLDGYGFLIKSSGAERPIRHESVDWANGSSHMVWWGSALFPEDMCLFLYDTPDTGDESRLFDRGSW